MATQAKRDATYADILALPPNMIGQIVYGVLYANPRPAPKHAQAASTLGEELGPPFKRGRGGPGGWIILDEPELHLAVPPAQNGYCSYLDFGGWLWGANIGFSNPGSIPVLVTHGARRPPREFFRVTRGRSGVSPH